tara:strand:- start:1692 stop:3071 length:1380 start_codon:yes stop_codon:yes gene_type:complete
MEGIPTKMNQMGSAGKKAVDKIKNATTDMGEGIKNLFSKKNPIENVKDLTEGQIQNQKMEAQVLFFIFLFVGILFLVGLIFISKTFRVYTSLKRMEVYKSSELNRQSIVDITDGPINDFYVASAYRPYVCYNHKYDYCSLEVFRDVLMAGPRFIELEIFNDSFSTDVEPVVATGSEEGEWQFSLNSLPLTEVLKVIVDTVFNQQRVKKLYKDPFFIYLNLKVNRNLICLEKIAKYIYEILGQYLLDVNYSHNSQKSNTEFSNTPITNLQKRITIFAKSGFEGSPLEEIVNYSNVSDFTLDNNPHQHRLLYMKNIDIIEKEQDLVETSAFELDVKKDKLKEYNKCGMSIISPEGDDADSFLSNISPRNIDPTKSLESGCQFIMMNYQMIDTHMSNYMYIFKDSSFILKNIDLTDPETDPESTICNKVFSSIKVERSDHTNKEIVYAYTTPNIEKKSLSNS